MEKIDITGQIFGWLTVIGETTRIRHDGKVGIYRLCMCKCGNTTEAMSYQLKNGSKQSCGCKKGFKHGHTKFKHPASKTYASWLHMKDRCNNQNNSGYKYYGGKGISVCEEWKDFNNFLSDMGERPAGKTIDRIDTNGNYTPDNCRWATPAEQSINRNTNHTINVEKGKSAACNRVRDAFGKFI